MEFWTVDEQGRLCDGQPLTETAAPLEPEFIEPLVEVRTAPHEQGVDLRRDLRSRLRAALGAAHDAGMHLVPLGTPLTGSAAAVTSDRGELFERIYGDHITSAKNCAGTHVHFEKVAPVRQLNLLTALDPALALVNSSPYYLGERLQQSSRAQAYRQRSGGEFAEYCDLWSYTDSVAEWDDRVAASFQGFQDVAADRGVDPSTVADYFSPEDAVLNPVRLRDTLPTVEWRAPDTGLPSQTVDLALDMAAVVERTAEESLAVGDPYPDADEIAIPTFDELREITDAAIREGLASPEVCRYLLKMGFDPGSYHPLASQLAGPETLTAEAGRRLRLDAAGTLRHDVRTMGSATPESRVSP